MAYRIFAVNPGSTSTKVGCFEGDKELFSAHVSHDAAKLAEFEQRGWARRRGRRWQFTPEGFLLSNQLIGQLLELQENASLGGMLERVRRNREAQKENKESKES